MEKLATVLLVDDDTITNFLNQRLLKRLAIAEQLYIVESGDEALAWLSQVDTPAPDLLLLDMSMPGMSGIEFLTAYQLQRQAQAYPTVVVMLTTTVDNQDLVRIQKLPIEGLISKPLTEEKINHLLQLHFQRHLPEKDA